MKKLTKFALTAAVLLGAHLFGSEAKAASFDCAKASAPIEKLICTSEELNRLDSALGQTYRNQRKLRSDQGRDQLKRSQRAWLKNRLQTCHISKASLQEPAATKAEQCLIPLYQARIDTLTLSFTTLDDFADALPEIVAQAKSLQTDISSLPTKYGNRFDRRLSYLRDRYRYRNEDGRLEVEQAKMELAEAADDPHLWANLAQIAFEAEDEELRAVAAPAALIYWINSGPNDIQELRNIAPVALYSGHVAEARKLLQLSNFYSSETRLQNAFNTLQKKFGFKQLSQSPDVDNGVARICLEMSHKLPSTQAVDFDQYVQVRETADISYSSTGRQLCLSGFEPGQSYTVDVRSGLPAQNGLTLLAGKTLRADVPDLPASVGFPGSAYVMPKIGGKGIPLTTVNLDEVKLKFLRISDRNIIHQKRSGTLFADLSRWRLSDLTNYDAEEIWTGSVAIDGPRNESHVTSLPITELIQQPKPGIYLLTAQAPSDEDHYRSIAAQWIIVSDLGLITYAGDDGLTVAVRSLATGKPIADVDLTIYGQNNHKLDSLTSDAQGVVRFDPGWLRGTKGNTLDSLMASTVEGDFAYLDLTGPAFDLSDRGVGGRVQVGKIDGFLYTERGIYRPGETVHLTGMVRDDQSQALADQNITLIVRRPDEAIAGTFLLTSNDVGLFQIDLPTARTDRTGTWTASLHLTPKGPAFAKRTYRVDDFVPPKIEVSLSSAAAALQLGQEHVVTAQVDYLYGAPATGLAGEAEAVLEPDPAPFKGYEAYQFGRMGEAFTPIRQSLTMAPTNAQGTSQIALTLPPQRLPSVPLRVKIRASVFEEGGRPVGQIFTLPLRADRPALGLKPGFDGKRISYRKPIPFTIVALDASGNPLPNQALNWRLVKEERDYFWYSHQGEWNWRYSSRDVEITSSKATTDGNGSLTLTLKGQSWGYYRLEVTDPATKAISSYKFQSGWSSSPIAGTAPDRMLVKLDKPSYQAGETAQIYLEAPFAGEVLLSVLNNKTHLIQQLTVPAEGKTIPLTVSADWGVGAYVTATALRPAGADADRGPSRAMGLSWMSLTDPERTLSVKMTVPERVLPNQSLTIPVQVSGLKQGRAQITLAAVDDGVLQFTNFKTPAPGKHFNAKRRLGVDIRDLYGRLIDARKGKSGTLRSGGDASGLIAGPNKRSSKVVSLFSGLVDVDEQGMAEITFDIPDFNGRLRLMAVAVGDKGVGSTDARLIVRDPVVARLSLPRFLAPGDMAELQMSVAVTDGAPGDYAYELDVDGPLTADLAPGSITLAPGEKSRLTVPVTASDVGDVSVTLRVDGPGDSDTERSYDLSIRAATVRSVKRDLMVMAPGQELVVDASQLDGLIPGSAQINFSGSSGLNIDATSLLNELSLYPYGCLEQTTSRALPLVYFGEVVLATNSRTDATPELLKKNIEKAARRISSMQRSDGSFGLWRSSSPKEPWLTAYALDFLIRANEAGYTINPQTVTRGLAWMRSYLLDNGSRNQEWWVTAPYGAYVLAKAAQIELADLRYLFDDYANSQHTTKIGNAQYAAALALMGDQERVHRALGLRLARFTDKDRAYHGYFSYSSDLRDAAALYTFTQEAGDPFGQTATLGQNIAEQWLNSEYSSTQAKSWLLLATHAAQSGEQPSLTLNGTKMDAFQGTARTHFTGWDLSAPNKIVNQGSKELNASLITTGHPLVPQPANSDGFTIDRQLFTLEGAPLEASSVKQNDLLVAVITGRNNSSQKAPSRALVVDLLPAGLELEDGALNKGASVSNLAWVGKTSDTTYEELRDDRYLAAITINRGDAFRLAYLVRAVTPGAFVLPNVHIEDMYAPELNARSNAGRLSIDGAQ